jgi:tartrate dehydrogenase/decarboxylase/D-malate dehydrogenase
MSGRIYRIACIPGDGIGKEVVPAGRTVLETVAAAVGGGPGGFDFHFTAFDWGGDYYRRHGVMMPEAGLDEIRDMDAILFGSAGDPDIADHITLWGLRLKICQGFDQYANVRPTRILPGIDAPLKRCAPKDLDWVIVRENSEGEYAGVGGRVHQGHLLEAATDVSMMTRAGVERIMRFAFALAGSRPRKQLTVVTKSNAQRHAMVMWDEIAVQISREFPDVKWDKELVDACTARMVNRPGSLDTLVATNLHADILSDLAAALAGSLGIAPTGNIDPERRYPSMFEPIHGSAFDIMGKGLANPIGTFWSVVMMLEHLGQQQAAAVVMESIEAVTADPALHPRDLGGKATTAEVTRAVCEHIRQSVPDRQRQPERTRPSPAGHTGSRQDSARHP